VVVSGLKGGSVSYWLSKFLRDPSSSSRDDRKKALLIIANSSIQAEELVADFLFFSPQRKEEVGYFPAWEPHPFDTFSPHPDIVIARLEILYRLLQRKDMCVVTTIEALSQRLIPQEMLMEQTVFLKKEEEINRDQLFLKLIESGYSRVTTVEDRGTFSVRGGIVDIFPPLTQNPFRLEFLGDIIETIRLFDASSQRSEEEVSQVSIIPVREIIYTKTTQQLAMDRVKQSADEMGVAKLKRDQIVEYLEHRVYFPGVDYYLPFFYSKTDHFLDYFSDSFNVVYLDKTAIQKNLEEFEKECQLDYEKAIEQGRISCKVAEFYVPSEEWAKKILPQPYWNISPLEFLEGKSSVLALKTQDNDDIRHDLKRLKITSLEILHPLAVKLKSLRQEGWAIFFVAHTQVQRKRFRELMEHYGLRFFELKSVFSMESIAQAKQDQSFLMYDVVLVSGILSKGFRFEEEKIMFIAEEEIFGERKKIPKISISKKAPFVTNLAELIVGDPLVHVDHGIGLYQGLTRLKIDEHESDYMVIEYAGGDKLYLPVHRLNVVNRYSGADKNKVNLDKLGGKEWIKTKKKVKQGIQEIAHELLNIYATRKTYNGFSFGPADSYFHELEATFPYEETTDQFKAIEEVLSDMCSSKPMDRIICGDVGYGKTEVAIRAAFKAVMDKKQVAVLAPTTLLVDQHHRVFMKRLEQFPVTVDALSRFKNKKEQLKTVQKLKKGEVDIIIGTHRLLSSDVEFFDLGLLIIDEEQRFGVVHKEKIKKIKKTLDVLTLSATPIPRTLHMALLGIRDISIINTPPQDRLSIRTYLTQFNDETIREALLQEIHRGGQVFFIHNRVETIAGVTKHLQKLVPEAKIHFAHGQMKESSIEKIMLDFLNKEFQVLVCTTIVGSGIDIPSANTIIIDRADTFGLAQLYQLRGRVGRSRERAYAYLLIPEEGRLSDDAKKRLQVIQGASELGSGFKIASHDLEIRGGGNILGKDQSGMISAIGFELYTDLLEETVRELKGEDIKEAIEPEMNIKIAAYIPQDYISEMGDKISFYRQLASLESEEELQDIEAEMKDRFGELPSQVYNLFELMAIKFYLKKLHVKALDFGNQKAVLTFSETTPLDPQVLLTFIKKDPKHYQLKVDNKFVAYLEDWKHILPFVRNLTSVI